MSGRSIDHERHAPAGSIRRPAVRKIGLLLVSGFLCLTVGLVMGYGTRGHGGGNAPAGALLGGGVAVIFWAVAVAGRLVGEEVKGTIGWVLGFGFCGGLYAIVGSAWVGWHLGGLDKALVWGVVGMLAGMICGAMAGVVYRWIGFLRGQR